MIAILNPGTPGESLTAVMSGAAATTNPTYQAFWQGREGPNHPVGALNGATAVTLVSAPSAHFKTVDSIKIYNGDTAAVTVTIAKVSGGVSYSMNVVTIPVGGMFLLSELGPMVIDSSGRPLLSIGDVSAITGGVGTVAGATVLATETGNVVRRTLLTLTNLAVTLVDANVGGGAPLYTFPLGRILLLGSVMTVTPTTTSTIASTLNSGVTLSMGVGSVRTTTQGSGTLATTQQDIVGAGTCVSSTTINVAGTAGSTKLAASAQFDGTVTPLASFLNFGVVTNTDIDADATITVNGTITLNWINIGTI